MLSVVLSVIKGVCEGKGGVLTCTISPKWWLCLFRWRWNAQNLAIAKAKLQGHPVPVSGEAGSCQALPMAGQVSPLRPGNKDMALKVLLRVSRRRSRKSLTFTAYWWLGFTGKWH